MSLNNPCKQVHYGVNEYMCVNLEVIKDGLVKRKG
jgi:hypothetical protein